MRYPHTLVRTTVGVRTTRYSHIGRKLKKRLGGSHHAHTRDIPNTISNGFVTHRFFNLND